ncbi:unnamed protein product [Cuscuta epithymum]|uniref:Uncharacterized protein n=1 Tax=Cuscuta epithymum TaxID=186058 RepID=A0AAV0G4R8_9ASTE|nr:unnamed protein product [Cuscuta epithymum]
MMMSGEVIMEGGSELKKGPWKAEEDEVLLEHVRQHGPRHWSSIRSKGLLQRTGKSCRLRWVNKLRPNLKTGLKFSADEERIVIDLQGQFGNKWAKIATYLPGRTDNDVKNFWSSRRKRLARVNSRSSTTTAAAALKEEEEKSRCDEEESCSEWTSIPMLPQDPAAWFPFEPPGRLGLETAPCTCCGAGFNVCPQQRREACFTTTTTLGDGDDLALLDALGNAPPAADESLVCCGSTAATNNDDYYYYDSLIPHHTSFMDEDFPIDYDVFDDQLPNPNIPSADS